MDRTETQASPDRAPARRDDEPVFAVGELIDDRYEIERFIARGGMGEVYAATDRTVGGAIAIKAMRAELAADAAVVRRFRREVELARRVTSRHVCRIFDTGTHAALPFLTMELLAGETLAARLDRGKLPIERARPIADALIAGLAAAHKAGVVHRDLKTANVMLVPDGDGERVVITDFGLAHRDAALGDATHLTGSAIVGTPAYMAPEQVLGEPTSPATDVYALGVVLFELATGQLPFRGDTPMATAALRLQRDAPAPRTAVPGWDAAITACLARDPGRRPAPVEQVRAILDGARPRRRWPWLALALGAAAAATVTAAVVMTRGAAPPRAVTTVARQLRLVDSSEPANTMIVALSPDGARVAIADAKLRVMEVGGEPRELALPDGILATRASWYPDATRILLSVLLEDGKEIGVIDTARARYERITRDAWGGAIAPDGQRFAAFTPAGIALFSVAGGEPTVLAPSQQTPYMTVAWSPDGRRIAALDALGLRIIDVDAATVTPVPGRGEAALVEAGVSWLSDGRLVFGVNTDDGATIDAMPPGGGPFTELAVFPTQQLGAIDSGDRVHLTITARTSTANVFAGALADTGPLTGAHQVTRDIGYEEPLAFSEDGAALFIFRQGRLDLVPVSGDDAGAKTLYAGSTRGLTLVDGGATAIVVRDEDGVRFTEELTLATGAVSRRHVIDEKYWSVRCTPVGACTLESTEGDEIVATRFDRERGVLERIDARPIPRDISGPRFALSPDGTQLAWTHHDEGLELVTLATGVVRTAPIGCDVQSLSWLDATRQLVTCMANERPRYQIRLVEADGTSRLIEGQQDAWMHQPIVDPGGHQVAYSRVDLSSTAFFLDLR